MALSNFNLTRDTIAAVISKHTFAELLDKTVQRIDGTTYFHWTGVLLRKQQIISTPACIIYPNRTEIVEFQLSGNRYDVRYFVDLFFAIREPNDNLAAQVILGLSSILRRKMSRNDDDSVPMVFSGLPSGSIHYNTVVRSTTIEEVALLENESVSTFSSGLVLEFSVWENYD